MRVLLVTPYPPKPDGIGAHTCGLATALDRIDDVDAEILTGRRPVGPVAGPPVHRVLAADRRGARDAARILRERAPDVVHYQFAVPALGLAALPAFTAGTRARAARPDTRIVVTLHEIRREVDLLGPVGRRIHRAVIATADAVVVHTQDARALAIDVGGIDPERVHLMPLGGPRPAAPSLAPEAVARVRADYGLGARPLVLSFGYLHPDKGLAHLIDAITRLRDRGRLPTGGLDVLVAGSVRPRTGVFRAFGRRDERHALSLRRAVAARGLSGTVRFVGFVPGDDVPGLFAAARVVAVPYTKVTQSSVLDTATAAGAPVVASDLPGLRESLGDGGILVPPGDADRLADALDRVLRDDALTSRLRVRQQARADVIGFDAVAAGLADRYRAIVTDAGRSARVA